MQDSRDAFHFGLDVIDVSMSLQFPLFLQFHKEGSCLSLVILATFHVTSVGRLFKYAFYTYLHGSLIYVGSIYYTIIINYIV